MNVLDIRLKNFRNHTDSLVKFGSGINLLVGDNGQGKTNIIEAVSYLSLTKSLFSASDATVLQIGEESFDVFGRIESDAGLEHSVRAVYVQSSSQKRITINNSRPQTLTSVIGRFPVVILAPDQMAITAGGPAERRKFVDLLLSQISRSYFEDLLEYRRVLKQRNKILSDAKSEHTFSQAIIEPWTESLINHGSRIIYSRYKFVLEFQSFIERMYRVLVGENEIPELRYSGISELASSLSLGEIETRFRAALKQREWEERKRGLSLVGPHRDDFQLSLNGKNLQRYASQGQHKTYLISLKLAEFSYIAERRNEKPLMLLDDMFSELDELRSRSLLDYLALLGQTIITATGESVFHGAVEWNGKNKRFYVEKGTCREG